MNPNQDYKQLLTDVIKKQIVILGPDITLSKARNVKGLVVANDGTVTDVQGSPQEVTQALIDQFVQLSGLIVKKTMEPLLSMSQTPVIPGQAGIQSSSTPQNQNSGSLVKPGMTENEIATPQALNNDAGQVPPAPQETINQAVSQVPQQTVPISSQPTQSEPANNPLAA